MNLHETRPRSLILALSLVLVSGLLSSCSKTAAQDGLVDAAIKRYERVRTGMSKQEVVALLGEPSARRESRYRWEAAGRPHYNASLEVTFDGDDRINSVARSRAKD